MTELNKRDLDNYITGHYGEDQFKCGSCGGYHEDDEPCDPQEEDHDFERDAEMRADARSERMEAGYDE